MKYYFADVTGIKNFTDIFKRYLYSCFIEKFHVVVFDGYTSSTKDITGKSETVEFDDSNMRLSIEIVF